MIKYYEVFIAFIPLIIAAIFIRKPSKAIRWLIVTLSLVTVSSILFYALRKFGLYNTPMINVYCIIYMITLSIAYHSLFKEYNKGFANRIKYFTIFCASIYVAFIIRNGIVPISVYQDAVFCLFNVCLSISYFYFIILLSDEIDLMADPFFLVSVALFIFYSVCSVILFSEHEALGLNSDQINSLGSFQKIVFSGHLILISIALYKTKNSTLLKKTVIRSLD